MSEETSLDFAPFRVRVDAARAKEFARETGFDDCETFAAGDAAPLAYPALWLTAEGIRKTVTDYCERLDSAPVHETQRFTYEAPLLVGEEYELHVSMRSEASPSRLSLAACVLSLAGEPVARVETLLRVVSRAALQREEKA